MLHVKKNGLRYEKNSFLLPVAAPLQSHKSGERVEQELRTTLPTASP